MLHHGLLESEVFPLVPCSSSSDDTGGEIEFRLAADVTEVLTRVRFEDERPGVLCAASPDLLLYEDRAAPLIRRLDCSKVPPVPAIPVPAFPVPALVKRQRGEEDMDSAAVDSKTQEKIEDLCVVEHRGRQLVVGTCSTTDKIIAYNAATGRQMWKVIGHEAFSKPTRMTTDGWGHLFVCHSNGMGQLASDGKELPQVVDCGFDVMRNANAICWNEAASGLTVHYTYTKHN